MANKQIIGSVEITTGAFTPTASMPVYQGENGATELNLTILNNGAAYTLPVGASLRAYAYYETKNEMTLSILMTVTGNVATCDIPDFFLEYATRAKIVVRELDAENITTFCGIYMNVAATIADTVVALAPVTMDLLRPPYINTSNGHWYEWDTASETYVDSGVAAAGDGNYVAFISQTLTDAQKLQARTNIAALGSGDLPSASDATPQDNGTATPGTSDDYSRADHVHDSDDTKADIIPTATEDNFASFDEDGNIQDSGKKASDFEPVYATATLLSTGWSGSGPYTQTVTATGVKSGDYPMVDLVQNATQATAENEIASYACLLYGKVEVSADNKITATCYSDQPTVDLNLRLVVAK